jgi:hypothetical protein
MAGMFYPAGAEECRLAARELLLPAPQTALPQARGAVVPHAGWICSGLIAGQAISTLALLRPVVDVVVVFGAIHTSIPIDRAVFDSHKIWSVPGGDSSVAAPLRDELAAEAQFGVDDRFHTREHAVEVELPLIQQAWPKAGILPLETPPMDSAPEMGRRVAQAVARAGYSAVYLASSDLTHYGPAYGFTPAGVGESALDWAMDNDRRILRLITNMTPEKIVNEAKAHQNACGAGAIAAMMAACQFEGATSAVILRHANSYQTLADIAPQTPDNAVGYAGVLVG